MRVKGLMRYRMKPGRTGDTSAEGLERPNPPSRRERRQFTAVMVKVEVVFHVP